MASENDIGSATVRRCGPVQLPTVYYRTAMVAVAGLLLIPTLRISGCAGPGGVLSAKRISSCPTPSTRVGAAPANVTVAGWFPTVAEAVCVRRFNVEPVPEPVTPGGFVF